MTSNSKPELFDDQVLANGGRIFTRPKEVAIRDEVIADRFETLIVFRNHVLVRDDAARTLFEAGRQHQKHLMTFMRFTKEQVEDQRKATREEPRCESCHGESLEQPLVQGECAGCVEKREERKAANRRALSGDPAETG